MNKFKELFEANGAKDLVKILQNSDASILNHPEPTESDVIEWAEGSIDYAADDGYADAFDMSVSEFQDFARQVQSKAKKIAKLLNK